MKENLSTIKEKVKVILHGKIKDSILVSGKLVNKMAKEHT